MACNPTYKGKRYNSLDGITPYLSYPELSRLFHTSKASGERPEFVKAIEDLFTKKTSDEKNKNQNAEGSEGQGKNAEGQITEAQKAEILTKANDIISKTQFDGMHEEMKKNPEEFLKYISEQASGSEEARTELESGKGMTKSLIDLATKLYPENKNTENETELEKQLPDTLSPEEKRGAIRGGEANAEATILTGAIHSANQAAKERGEGLSPTKVKEKEAEYLTTYAKDNGLWVEDKFGEPHSNGVEQDVYINPDGKSVTKINSGVIHDSWNEFFHRLALHNSLFPDTGYTLKGFTEHDGNFSAVLEQPLIKKGGDVKFEDIKEDLAKSGFEPLHPDSKSLASKYSFINKNTGVILSDLHGENVIKGTDGNLHYIDPVIDKDQPNENIVSKVDPEEFLSSLKSKSDGNSKQGRQQEGLSEETLHEEGQGQRKGQEGLSDQEALNKEGVENRSAPPLSVGSQVNFGGKVWDVEDISDEGVKISDPKTNTVTTIPKEEAEKNIKQPPEENKNPPDITSVANKVVNKERAARGLDPIQKAVKRAWKTEVLKDANEQIDSGKVDPQVLARELNKNPRPLTDTEDAILTIGRMQLWNAHKNSMNAIEEGVKKGDKGSETVARMGLTYIEDAMYENDMASKKAGTQNARGLAARRMMIASDYSLANQKQRYRIANMGKEIPREVVEKMEQYSKDLEEANRKLEEYQEKLKNAEAEKELTKVKETVKKSPKAPKKAHEDFVKERKEIVSDIRDKLKKARGETTATIVPYAKELFTIAPDVAKLVRSLVEEGVSKLEDVVKNVHDVLRDEIKGITEKDVNDIIAGEYNEKRKPITELASKLKDLRDEANLINKYDQLKKSPEPKEETKKVQRNKEITELKEKIAEEKRLPDYKQRLLKQINDTETAIREKNLEPKTRKPIVLDREAQILQGRVEDVKRKFDTERIKLEKANRSKYEKSLDFLTKWYRLDLLSGVTVLGKLTSAAQLRMALTPLEEGIGGVLSHIPGISSIAKQAPREGGFSIAAEAKAMSQYWDKGTRQDMWSMIRSGKNPMELIYGKKYDLPAEAIGFFGQLHSALKVLPKRAEFNRSFEKRYAWAKKNGQDVSDPMVQTQIASAAYNDAARAIFMQDNLISDAYKLGLSYLENKGDGGKAAGFVLRTLLPIIKVPTNIVGEAFSYAGGGVKAAVMARKQIAGGMKMMLGLKKGIDKLTPDQADTVMRNLKKQTLGAAFFALGYFGSANVGGYYTGKRDEDEVEEGGLRMFGVDIPKWMVHNPALEMLQLGATVKKVQDKYEDAGKDNAVEAGVLAGISGLTGQVPFIDNPKRVTEALRSPAQADKYADEFIKSLTIPQLLQEASKLSDEDAEGKVIKRYPKNLFEYEESGIPGARKNVSDEK